MDRIQNTMVLEILKAFCRVCFSNSIGNLIFCVQNRFQVDFVRCLLLLKISKTRKIRGGAVAEEPP